MNSKIFIGGLHWKTTEPGLKQAFSFVGEVASVRIILDKETGRSRCFGFVQFSSAEEAKTAIEKCNGMLLDGRNIKVSEAKERERKPEAREEMNDPAPKADEQSPDLEGFSEKQAAAPLD